MNPKKNNLQKNFNDFIENSLNTNQKKSVIDKNGVFLVIAGAGSGKTRVITSRIINLILNHNIEPSTSAGWMECNILFWCKAKLLF